MKILKNSFDIQTEIDSDPGDYPNNVAQYALPDREYISDITGELIVQLEPGDIDPESDLKEQYDEIAKEYADIDSEVKITDWWHELNIDGDKLTSSVKEFEQSCY